MVKFESKQFLNDLKEYIKYWEDTSDSKDFSYLCDFYDVTDESFDPSEYEDDYVGYDSVAPLCCEVEVNITFRELFKIMKLSKSAQLIDNLFCYSDCSFLCRVSVDYEKFKQLDSFFDTDKTFIEHDIYKSTNITCSLVKGFTLYGYMIMSSGDYDNDYLPAVSDNDLFINIIADKKLSLSDYKNILNSYVFEIDSSYNIFLKKDRRPYIDDIYEEDEEDDKAVAVKGYKLRPLIFGKGLKDVTKLYNSVSLNDNYDMIIIQYTKILEYISQTALRQITTQSIKIKLMNPRALNPDADYIKDLETAFDDLRQKYNSDRDAIKLLIESCCDIKYLSDYAPPYLAKLKNLKKTLNLPKVDKQHLIIEAVDLVSNSISDTRNFIAHAKANYTLKGTECPEDQKFQFIKMLRVVVIQAIRWFSTINEDDRITNN